MRRPDIYLEIVLNPLQSFIGRLLLQTNYILQVTTAGQDSQNPVSMHGCLICLSFATFVLCLKTRETDMWSLSFSIASKD